MYSQNPHTKSTQLLKHISVFLIITDAVRWLMENVLVTIQFVWFWHRHEKRSLLWAGKTQTMINKCMQMMETARSLNTQMPPTFATENKNILLLLVKQMSCVGPLKLTSADLTLLKWNQSKVSVTHLIKDFVYQNTCKEQQKPSRTSLLLNNTTLI